MRRAFRIAVNSVLLFILYIGLALAQTVATPVVVVPVGGWVEQIAPIVQDILLAAVTGIVAWVAQSLPAAIRTYVSANITAQAEQILSKAIDWGIAAVAGATKDKIWTIPIGNQVVAESVQYVIDHGPAWLITWMGGRAMIAQKVIARIGDLLPDNAQVAGSSTSSNATTISAGPVGAANAGAPASPMSIIGGSPSIKL